MALPYQELYYASTQQSMDTGADGFGVRTYSSGWPAGVIDRIKSRNVFAYEAGDKPLAGTFELIERPDLVLEYPKTYRYFQEVVNGQKFYIFTRTVYIGRDYGWYLEEKSESARSGNIFAHALLFSEEDFSRSHPGGIFSAILGLFRPLNYKNDPGNKELKQLLTNQYGPPIQLPTGHCSTCDQPALVQTFEGLGELLVAVYWALETNKKIVIVQESRKAEKLLATLLACLPRFVLKGLSFATNYHSFNLDTEYTVLLLNEYYQRELPLNNPHLFICNLTKGILPGQVPDCDFYGQVKDLIRKSDFITLREMNDGFDQMAASMGKRISFNQLYYAWLHLMTTQEHRHNFSPAEVIQEIKDYDLNPSFKARIEAYIMNAFKEAISLKHHSKVAGAMRLLTEIGIDQQRMDEAKALFSNYFWEEDNAALLLATGLPVSQAFQFVILQNQKNAIVNFIGASTLSEDTMEYFLQKIIEGLSEKEDVESIFFSALMNHKIGPGFTDNLKKTWGADKFFRFLEDHDFFIYLGEAHQIEFFGKHTQQYLRQLPGKGEAAVALIKKQAANDEFFHQYLDCIISQAIEENFPYAGKIQLFEYYIYLLKEGIQSLKNSGSVDELLKDLLLTWPNDDNLVKPLLEAAKDFGRPIRSEYSLLKGQPGSITYMNKLEYYNKVAEFIQEVLMSGSNLNILANLPLEFCNNGKIPCSHFVRFLLSSIPVDKWLDPDSCKKLCIYFLGHDQLKNLKLSFEEYVSLLLPEFIPMYYNRRIAEESEDEGKAQKVMIDFTSRYTETLWGLRPKKWRGEGQQTSVTLRGFVIIDKIAFYLNDLSTLDRSACKSVIEYIKNEVADPDDGLVEYLNKEIKTDGIFSTFLKKISFFKKPRS